MAVYRVERTRDYTVMSNCHLKDTSLSLKAKGLLSMMLSLPNEWNYNTRGLAAICKEGVDGATLSAASCGGRMDASQTRSTPSMSSPSIRTRPRLRTLRDWICHIRKTRMWRGRIWWGRTRKWPQN